MLTDEAVREYLRDTETHSRFVATVATGSPNYKQNVVRVLNTVECLLLAMSEDYIIVLQLTSLNPKS